MNPLDYISGISAVAIVVVGVFFFGWVKILQTTNKLLKEQNIALLEQNVELKKENKDWFTKHLQNEKAIAMLQGQIETLSVIPVGDIKTSLKALEVSNQAIVTLLQTSAITLAKDTQAAAVEAAHVRLDLAAK